MSYISHEDYKNLMSKFQAETPKGMLKEAVEVKDRGYQDNITPESPLDEKNEMEEGWNYDEEGEEHSLAVEKELQHLAQAGKIDAATLDKALDYVSDHDYELYAHNLDANYVLKQVTGVEEGNAFTGQLHKHKPGEKFKVGGKTYKDIAKGVVPEYAFDQMYPEDPGPFEEGEGICPSCGMPADQCQCGQEMDESHPANEQWLEAFHDALGMYPMINTSYLIDKYGHMKPEEAAEQFMDDATTSQMAKDKEKFRKERGFEEEIKKMKEIAGIKSHDDGPEDDDDEAREARAKKMEDDDTEAENAEREDEGFNPDETDFEQAVAEHLKYLSDDELTDKEYEQALEALEDPKVVSQLWDLDPAKAATALAKMIRKQNREDIPGFGGTWDALGKIGIREETAAASDGSHMRDPAGAAKVVAQKHGKELKDLKDIYDSRSDADHKVRNKAYKDYENAAINWCGHEMLEAGMKRVVVQNLLSGYGYFEDWVPDYLESLEDELGNIEENIYEPLQKATGPTIMQKEETNDTNPPYGFSVLSPDERKQLKEYIESLKTIKKEIGNLLEKAGKSDMMEGMKAGYVKGGEIKNKAKAADTKRPAEIKPKYHNPEKKQKPGGNRTDLVMKKGEMWEGQEADMDPKHKEMESHLDPKLHDVLHKVADKVIDELVAAGFTRGEALAFIDHEIEEKGKEAVMAQHDPY